MKSPARASPVRLLAGLIVLTILYFQLSGLAASVVYDLIGLIAGLVMLRSARSMGGDRGRPWYTFAIGILLWVAGDVIITIYEGTAGAVPFPSFADLPYLAGYAFLGLGIAGLIRQEGSHDRDDFIDAAIVGVTVGTFMWAYLTVPSLDLTSSSIAAVAVGASYPMLDALLIVLAFRLSIGHSLAAKVGRFLIAACR